MSFLLNFACYLLGTAAVAVCLWAIPGPGSEAPQQAGSIRGPH